LDLKARIAARVNAEPARVWTAVDFADLGPRAAIDKSLQRLTGEANLSRVCRGLYYRPGTNALTGKPTTPDVGAIIDAIARRDQIRVILDGMTAANDLGLTTAVPARVTVLTHARLRPIQMGNQKIIFQAVAPKRLYWAGRPAMRVVQALYWLRDLLESDDGIVLQRLRAILADSIHGRPIRDDLKRGLPMLPIWLQSIVRRLLETEPPSVVRRAQSRRREQGV
jgi:hypothetical protein